MRCNSRGHLLVALIVSVALGACATQPQMITDSPGVPASNVPSPPTESAAAPAPAAPPAGRAARAPTVPAPPSDQPMTVTKAREQCWMQAETQRARDIETRVKFVEQCVKDKMK
jgi:hypothetical protein